MSSPWSPEDGSRQDALHATELKMASKSRRRAAYRVAFDTEVWCQPDAKRPPIGMRAPIFEVFSQGSRPQGVLQNAAFTRNIFIIERTR